MFVSVVVTALNSEDWIVETLESILNQSHADFEVLVVDDGSTDGTLAILNEFVQRDERVIVLSHPNWGMAASANDAIARARGDWILRADADDLMMPERIKRQILFVESNPDVVASASFIYYIDDSGTILGSYDSDLTTRVEFDRRYKAMEPVSLPHQSAIMRKDVFLDVGGYRGQFWSADDMDLFNRMAEKGYVLIQPELLQKYRIHSSSVSNTKIREQLAKMRWVEMCIRRRRTGRPEPTWDEFQESERTAPFFRRINHQRSILGLTLYKRGAMYFSARNYWKMVVFLGAALVIVPRYSAYKIANRYLRFKIFQSRISEDARPSS